MLFVYDENNNRIEALDKEGVFALLAQAIADGSLANVDAAAAFVSKLKCCDSGQTNKIAFVTQARYNELLAAGEVLTNCYYFVTDDTTAESMDAAIEELQKQVGGILGGEESVSHAYSADVAAEANRAITAERLNRAAPEESGWHISERGYYYFSYRHLDLITSGVGDYIRALGVVYWDGETETYIEVDNANMLKIKATGDIVFMKKATDTSLAQEIDVSTYTKLYISQIGDVAEE